MDGKQPAPAPRPRLDLHPANVVAAKGYRDAPGWLLVRILTIQPAGQVDERTARDRAPIGADARRTFPMSLSQPSQILKTYPPFGGYPLFSDVFGWC